MAKRRAHNNYSMAGLVAEEGRTAHRAAPTRFAARALQVARCTGSTSTDWKLLPRRAHAHANHRAREGPAAQAQLSLVKTVCCSCASCLPHLSTALYFFASPDF